MRKYTYNLVVYWLLCFVYLVPISKAFGQIYSTGVMDEAKRVGFNELKIIETDPVLKQAKEVVPFDKPFFLKIKRVKIGNTILTIDTVITKNYKVTVGDTIVESKIEEKTFTSRKLSKSASISKVYLSRLDNISSKIMLSGKFWKEENADSEYIYVEIDNVRPEYGYQLDVVWDGNGKDDREIYYFTTVASTLDKRLKNRVSPQIGITTVSFKLPGRTLYIPLRLMVGAYYQLRETDPDIPFKSYRIYAWQRFSAYLGLTFNTLADGYIREDLFGTSNLLVGVGYQPMDAIRITAGPLLFNQLDPNRFLANRKSLAKTLYVGITLDVKLKDLLGGLIATLGFK